MELKDYIRTTLERSKGGLTRALNTIEQEEICWRPASGCNSMGLLIFHVAKSEDNFIHATLQGKPLLWDADKWYEKLNMPQDEAGSHYTVEQVNAFPVPDRDKLLEYYDSVRAGTLAYLDALDPAEFERKVKTPFAELDVAGIFSIIVSHTAQHTGEISYLRGMLRGMDK